LKSNLNPILKWAGGKEQELKYIRPAIPHTFDRYFEPFVGGARFVFGGQN
jgi:DNA adenine methylase